MIVRKKVFPIIVFCIISLGVGIAAAIITGSGFADYADVAKPSFAPPSIVFPIAWSVLYLLIGISAGLVRNTYSPRRENALALWFFGLAVNFLWPLFFFKGKFYWFSFFWLVLLILTTIAVMSEFKKIRPAAFLLQVPYIVWLVFAAVLNFAVAAMN